jgi:hypothetical protein
MARTLIRAGMRAFALIGDLIGLASVLPALIADRDRSPEEVARHGG